MKRTLACGLAALIIATSSAGLARSPRGRHRSSWRAAIARVLVEVRSDRLRVTTDVLLWTNRPVAPPLDVYAPYGAPGPPLAADAQLLAVPQGYLDAPDTARGEPIALHFAPTAPRAADLVLGPPHMAGSALAIGAGRLAAALASSGAACLRLRTVRPMPSAGPTGAHELIVRLGAQAHTPFVLGNVEVVGDAQRSEARLCEGRGVADRAIRVAPVHSKDRRADPPALVHRTSSDALCVRLWL